MYVQFTDATQSEIAASFAGPQPSTVPNQGVVEASDARWAAFYARFPPASQVNLTPPTTPLDPTLMQLAASQLAGGLNILSQSASGLNGLYSTTPTAQANITSIEVYIQKNGTFPGSSGTQLWLDMANTPHTFTATGQFSAFATAIADYVADLTMISLTGSGTLPNSEVTIA